MAEEDDNYTKDGTVDYKGRPANRKKTGKWRACPFIVGKLEMEIDILKIDSSWLYSIYERENLFDNLSWLILLD